VNQNDARLRSNTSRRFIGFNAAGRYFPLRSGDLVEAKREQENDEHDDRRDPSGQQQVAGLRTNAQLARARHVVDASTWS
jgi:hypothetical protein